MATALNHQRERVTHMDETKRLELIVEAVLYCQRVRDLGMPSSCYSKALREPVYFLWECRDGLSKERRPQFRSAGAVGMHFGTGDLVYDHAVPFKLLQDELMGLSDPTVGAVRDVLNRYGVIVLVTKEEDRRVRMAGYGSKMPDGWDRVDPIARYRAVGIELVENAVRST